MASYSCTAECPNAYKSCVEAEISIFSKTKSANLTMTLLPDNEPSCICSLADTQEFCLDAIATVYVYLGPIHEPSGRK